MGPATRSVKWKVSQLGPGQYSDLKLNDSCRTCRRTRRKVEAITASGHRAELPTMLEVAGFPSLKVDIHGQDKPVAVDEQVSMRVTVSNNGSAPDKNVTTLFTLPPEMTLISAEGPVQYTQEGKYVTFAHCRNWLPTRSRRSTLCWQLPRRAAPLWLSMFTAMNTRKTRFGGRGVRIIPESQRDCRADTMVRCRRFA